MCGKYNDMKYIIILTLSNWFVGFLCLQEMSSSEHGVPLDGLDKGNMVDEVTLAHFSP